MSHFTKLDKANIVDASAFEAAAKELGLKTERGVSIKDWAGKSIKVDVAAHVPGTYSVGIQKNGSKFDLLSDWSMQRIPAELAGKLAGAQRGNDLANRLIQLTTKHTLINQYRRQGFTARVTEDTKRNLTVTLTR